MESRSFYHVTARKNVPAIQAEGLLPQAGPRARAAGQAAGVFLFADERRAEGPCYDFLCDSYGEDGDAAILWVVLPADTPLELDGEWGFICREPIAPEHILVDEVDRTYHPDAGRVLLTQEEYRLIRVALGEATELYLQRSQQAPDVFEGMELSERAHAFDRLRTKRFRPY